MVGIPDQKLSNKCMGPIKIFKFVYTYSLNYQNVIISMDACMAKFVCLHVPRPSSQILNLPLSPLALAAPLQNNAHRIERKAWYVHGPLSFKFSVSSFFSAS